MREVYEETLELNREDQVRLALAHLEDIELELRRRKKDCGLEFYSPNPMQHRAHQSNARTIMYVGANRAGKTTFGAAELAMHLTRQYPDWFSKERRFSRPIKAVIVATEFPIIERAIEPKILAFLPKDRIAKLKRTPQGYLSRLVMTDGSTVDILSNEMDDMAFESADWDLYWGDEPQKKSKYYAIRRGLLDRQGLALLTFTPLIEPWMKEDLVDKADGKKIEVFTVTLYDNHQDLKGQTIMPLEAIKEFEAELPDDLKRTRVYGEFFHMRGLVYTEFSAGVHERLFDYKFPDPIICILDPHERKPHWVIWAWMNRLDDLHVDSELIVHQPLVELKKSILLHEARMGYRVARRLMDPNFGESPDGPGSSSTVRQTLAKMPMGVRFGLANDDKETGRFTVKDYLHYNPTQPLSATNKPKLWFHRIRAANTIRSLKNHQYEDWKGKARDDKDVKEKEKPKDTDGADCVRYLCISKPSFDRLARVPEWNELTEAAY